jgi:hypothetical protein
MHGWRLTDGRIMVPRRAGGPGGIIGDGMVPIAPDDPDFARWDAYLRTQEANRHSFAERFEETGGLPIWEGPLPVYPCFRLPLDTPERLTFEVRARSGGSAQARGIAVAMRLGRLQSRDGLRRVVKLWGAPQGVGARLTVHPAGDDDELLARPVWVNAADRHRSAVGDYGVLIEESAGLTVLRCSVGDGPADFDAVIVTITRS